MEMGKVLRELLVEPLLYPAAMPTAPPDPESPVVPAAEAVSVPAEE